MPRARIWRKSVEDGVYEVVGAQENYCVAELQGGNEEKVVRMRREECSLFFMVVFGYEC